MSEDGDERHSGLSLSPGASLGSSSAEGEAPVCRDYLRNVCKRGKRCKFRHPNASDTEAAAATMADCKAELKADCAGAGAVAKVNTGAVVSATMLDNSAANTTSLLGNLNFCHDFQVRMRIRRARV